jgi:hypothetical protein
VNLPCGACSAVLFTITSKSTIELTTASLPYEVHIVVSDEQRAIPVLLTVVLRACLTPFKQLTDVQQNLKKREMSLLVYMCETVRLALKYCCTSLACR